MRINDMILYENKHFIIVNDMQGIFYFFDYDSRNHAVNMEFQHHHPFFEILILLSPEAEHLIEGKHYHLCMNDIVLLPPSVLHKSIYYKGEPAKRIIINFMYPKHSFGYADILQNLLIPFFVDCPIFRFEPSEGQSLFSLLNEIFQYSRTSSFTGDEMNNFFIHLKFQEFLLQLWSFREKNIYNNKTSSNSVEQKIYDITAYIHKHYASDLSLDSLAKHFFISPSYLSHQFKTITHFNLVKYIQMTRIKNVQYQLITTNEPISKIADYCGFNSFSQFNRIFKQTAGVSPSEYRKIGILR